MMQLWRELGDELLVEKQADLAQYCRRQAAVAKPATKTGSIGIFHSIQAEISLLATRELLRSYSDAIGVPEKSYPSCPNPLTLLDEYVSARLGHLDPLQHLARLLESDSDFAEAWLEKAFCHFEAGDLVTAVAAALEAVKARLRCPRRTVNYHPHAEANALIGRCLEMSSLFQEAIGAYRNALAIDADQPHLRVCLGLLLWRTGSVEAAMAEFTRGMPFGYRLSNLSHMPRHIERLHLSLS